MAFSSENASCPDYKKKKIIHSKTTENAHRCKTLLPVSKQPGVYLLSVCLKCCSKMLASAIEQ